MSEVVLAAMVTGGFAIVIEILRRLLSQNKKDHDVVIGEVASLAAKHDDVRHKVYSISNDLLDVRNDVIETKFEVRKLRDNHDDLRGRVDRHLDDDS
jgi:uncharacterized coiled-coil DUF342 family protein